LKALGRLCLCGGIIGVLLFVSTSGASSLAARLGQHVTELLSLYRQIEEGTSWGEELERRSREVFHRLQTRYEIIDDVTAGRATLLEAAARFRGLETPNEPLAQLLRSIYGCASDEECRCRQVIAFLSHNSGDNPKRQARAAELERELSDYLEYAP
jgi:hypothetical protein